MNCPFIFWEGKKSYPVGFFSCCCVGLFVWFFLNGAFQAGMQIPNELSDIDMINKSFWMHWILFLKSELLKK